jgi:hypothetical protein
MANQKKTEPILMKLVLGPGKRIAKQKNLNRMLAVGRLSRKMCATLSASG